MGNGQVCGEEHSKVKSIQIRGRGSTQGHPAPRPRSTEHVLLSQL